MQQIVTTKAESNINKNEKEHKQMVESNHIPRCVKLNNDEIVLANSVMEVRVVQCKDIFLCLRFLSGDLRRKQHKERER